MPASLIDLLEGVVELLDFILNGRFWLPSESGSAPAARDVPLERAPPDVATEGLRQFVLAKSKCLQAVKEVA
jgi:hypothetical protein